MLTLCHDMTEILLIHNNWTGLTVLTKPFYMYIEIENDARWKPKAVYNYIQIENGRQMKA